MGKIQQIDFSKQQTILEQLLSELRGGQLSIEDSIKKFEEANRIISDLEKYLKESQNRISKVIDKTKVL